MYPEGEQNYFQTVIFLNLLVTTLSLRLPLIFTVGIFFSQPMSFSVLLGLFSFIIIYNLGKYILSKAARNCVIYLKFLIKDFACFDLQGQCKKKERKSLSFGAFEKYTELSHQFKLPETVGT